MIKGAYIEDCADIADISGNDNDLFLRNRFGLDSSNGEGILVR